jgi:hypothetical protein
MKIRLQRLVLLLAVAGAWSAIRPHPALVQTPEPSREQIEFFEKKIRPILVTNCFGCHSPQSKTLRGGLWLDSRASMLRGGASGIPAVTPGDPEQSLLVKAIRQSDSKLQMPPGGRLTDQEIADVESWVRSGAAMPASIAPASPPPAYDFAEARKFWSFQSVSRTVPPVVRNRNWVRNEVDQFILSKLEAKKIHPVADADKRTLIRRATFDLTGLPPSPAEIDAFLADISPNAFSKVVDRLLASPQYGERWGRHWLDLVRYADTAGDNSDFPIPSAYRYRNYVIKSFNQDKPYDQFIREQIAGDLLPSKDQNDRNEKIIATGYLAMSRRFGSRNKEFNLTIDDTIDNVGKTFLGLSVSCARCHDHKFDPIPARDYYAMYGIFNSSRYAFPGAEIYPHPADYVPLAPEGQARNFLKWQKEISDLDDRKEYLVAERGAAGRNKAMRDKEAKEAAEKTIDNKTGAAEQAAKDETAPPGAVPDALRPGDFDRDAMNWGLAGKSKRLPDQVEAEILQVRARIADLNERAPRTPKAYAVSEGLAANARIHRRGDPKSLGEEIPRGFLTILGGQQLPAGVNGSGRDALAGWIVDKSNPLTARVMVNRIWEYHFGKGIVATPNDFGSRGAKPTHPELLDYLASRFVENGWSIKAIHRLIMNSHAYQTASVANARNAAVDNDNNLFWRFERRRLSAEEIRDALLTVSGKLDKSQGEGHPFPVERDWHYTQHAQFFAVYPTNRRSVYLMQQRLKKHPLMEVFDGPDTNSSTPQRSATTTPVQALYLMNDPFIHAQADEFAVRVALAYDSLPRRIDYAYRLATGREATATEIRQAQFYLEKMRLDLKQAKVEEEMLNRKALASFLRVLLSSNEFLYVD